MREYYSNRLLNLRKQFSIIFLSAFSVSLSSQVSVTATIGSTSVTYATVSRAFDSINAGVHAGDVTLTITANTVEPTNPTPLNAPPANGYTKVTIRPQGVRTIGLSSLLTNQGIIQLFGAKNVVIDGDDPGVAGVDQSLTIGFTGGASFTNRAVIRIASKSTTDFAENITIKNCKIIGPRPNYVHSATNYGIVISDDGNFLTTTPPIGVMNRNITIENNDIIKCLYGIYSCGNTNATTSFSNIDVINNKIGITSTINDFVGKYGIVYRGSSMTAAPSLIEGNEIKVGIPTFSSGGFDVTGIRIEDRNPNLVVRYNYIHDIVNNTTATNANGFVVGIRLFGTNNTNVDINNNIIRDVISARKQTTLGNAANYGVYLVNFGSLKFNHNTLGLMVPNTTGSTASPVTCGAFIVNGNLQEYKNNVLVNNNSSPRAYCITSTSATLANTVMDRNCYSFPNGSCGNSAAPNTLANWQAATGKEATSFVENPPFISATDLHVQTGIVTQLESNAFASSYAFDIDLDSRPNPTDVGADEFNGTAYVAPVILNVNHSPTTQTCASTARTINAIFTTLGNSLDSVMLEYSVGGGANVYQKMSSASALGFTSTIPAVTPLNSTVRYRVYALTKVHDTVFSNYGYYNDNTASRALIPTLTPDPAAACANSTIDLRYSFLPDPTGFIFPPRVLDTNVAVNITNVKLINIDNTSPDTNSLVGSIGNATGVAGEYSNFRDLSVDQMYPGRSYPVSVEGTTPLNSNLYFAVFVDFNGDGAFTGADEMVYQSYKVRDVGTRTEKFNLYIPPNARPGKTAIRFLCSHAPIDNSYDDIFRGEVEDYSIQINPLKITWKTGTTTIGTGNPQSYTVASVPSSVYVEIEDSSSCTFASGAANITSSPSAMTVTLNKPNSACYNTPVLVSANITGGCAPYTYSWSNNSGLNAPNQMVTLLNDTLYLTVTVTDKNNAQYSGTGFILPNNPRLTTDVDDTTIICNRGSATINVNTASTDVAYWYYSPTTPALSFDFEGNAFTTPTLNNTKDFYVAAARSYKDSVGKMDLGGTSITNNYVPLSGLKFTAQEPVIIENCWMYMTGNAGATINVALLDKNGTIIDQTGVISPALPASVNTPTTIDLNFIIANPDTGYKLVLLSQSGLTALRRHTSGYSYPFTPASKPLVITSSYSITDPSSTHYFYFYRIRVKKGLCVGQKDTATAKVTPPRVPKLYEDLKYTLLCKDDTLRLKVSTDSFGDRFVWRKNGNVIQNFSVSPPSDTMLDSAYVVPISTPADTGLYRVEIHSSKFCTRDTFSREVRVSFHKEPVITRDLKDINMCLFRDTKLSIDANDASIYKWYKDTNTYIPSDTTKSELDLTNVNFSTSGIYHVVATDSNRCRDVKSLMVKVTVFDTPQFVTHPMDTVVCEDDRYVINSTPINATHYQWFKDNGIMNGFIKDSFTLYSAGVRDSGSYRIIASSYPGCPDAISNPGKIVVNPKPSIQGFYPANIKFCEDQELKIESASTNAQRIVWYKGSDSIGNFNSFYKANSSLSDAATYKFTVVGLNKCPNIESDTMKVTIVGKPSVSGTRPAFISCSGEEFKYGFTTTNGNIYQWYKNGVAVQAQADSQLTIPFLTENDNGVYHVMVNSDPICPEVGSNSFTIDIKNKPEIQVQPVGSITSCMGKDIQLNVGATNTNGFQWIKDGSNIAGATSNTLRINDLSDSDEGSYWVQVNGNSPCVSILSDTTTIHYRSGQTNAVASLVSVFDAKEQCTDKDNWTYYATSDEPSKFVFAVKKNGNSLEGAADIILRPSTYQKINSSGSEYTATLMLQRFWNYTLLSGDITNPIDVKFYVNQSELDDLETLKDEIKDLYIDDLELENNSALWFKTNGFPFSGSTLNSVIGNRFYFDSIIIPDYVEGIDNGVKYFEFKNISNIGGGSAFYSFKGSSRFLGSIAGGNSNLSLSISPNPNQGKFILYTVSKTLGDMQVHVVNSLGQTVYTDNIKLRSLKSENQIDIPHLASGIYQLILSKDANRVSLKLQIEK